MKQSKLNQIKEAIEIQKSVLKPIQEKYFYETKILEDLQKSLTDYQLKNGYFYPIEKLVEFSKDSEQIESIALVVKEKDALRIEWLFNNEIFRIDEKGHFYFSSFEDGIIQWDAKKKQYVKSFLGSTSEWLNVVGFMRIIYNSDTNYDINPPETKLVDIKNL